MRAYGTYEIAGICHVTPSTVGNWIEKGLLPTFTTGGGHRRVWDKDLAVFLKGHNMPVPSELKPLLATKILIVDDEEPIRQVLRRSLQKSYSGMEIHEAGDGFEAGQKMVELAPALVILDLMLPGIDGLKVCRLIHANENLKHVRILTISGNEPEESGKQALAAGADDFLAKPINLDDFHQKIRELLKLDSPSAPRPSIP